jgi:hypothetical protein
METEEFSKQGSQDTEGYAGSAAAQIIDKLVSKKEIDKETAEEFSVFVSKNLTFGFTPKEEKDDYLDELDIYNYDRLSSKTWLQPVAKNLLAYHKAKIALLQLMNRSIGTKDGNLINERTLTNQIFNRQVVQKETSSTISEERPRKRRWF